METPIKEDFKITNGFIYLLAAVVIAMLLAIGIWVKETRLMMILTSIFLVFFTWLCLRPDSGEPRARPGWLLTGLGLERIYKDKTRETIRWNQIASMRWVRFYGLIIHWDELEPAARSTEFKREFKSDSLYRTNRAILRVQSEEASKVISEWGMKREGS
jgi:hypothetical protein